MQILYPFNPLNPKIVDEPYQTEYEAVRAAGIPCALFDFDVLAFGEFRPVLALLSDMPTLYRGWMLTPQNYQLLENAIRKCGSYPVTSSAHYAQCHHLPGWYAQCRSFTAKTHFFTVDDDIVSAAKMLNWPAYFVKDYVKSNTGDKGSIAYSPSEIPDILAQLALYRGEIEGGISLRQVENYLPDTECRYFVVNGQVYGPNGDVPILVESVAAKIESPFYSVDVVQNAQGELRLVELGDGQVSSLKSSSIDWFIDALQALTE
ncbi:MAG: ATP-grasp domain-containing protein [Cyanobacteria bacterium P01_C01_bin.69]